MTPSSSRETFGPRTGVAVAIYVAVSIPLVFWGLSSYSIVNGDEAVYQEFALRMLDSGNWFRLMSGGEHRIYDTFMNAPIQYWMRGAIVTLIGPSLLAMRIHSAIFGLATVLMLHRLVLHVADRRAAFLAGLIQLTTYQFLYLHGSRTGELETLLCFLFVASAYLFIRAMEDERRSWILHHVCFLTIVNLKIPVVLIPALAELLCFAFSPRARRRLASWVRTGFVMLPFGLLWHIGQAIHLGDSFWAVPGQMKSQAGTTNRFGQQRGVGSNLLRYIPIVAFGTFPYLFALPLALIDVARLSRSGDEEGIVRRDRLMVLVCYAGAVFLFYMLVAKRGAWYPMPAYAFFAAMLGIWLSRLTRRRLGGAELMGIALVVSFVVWLRPAMTDYNPFARSALNIPMRMVWWGSDSVSPLLGVPLLAGVVLAGLHLGRRALRERFPPLLALTLAGFLIGIAGLRDLQPLGYLGYQSPLGKLRAEIDAKQAAGIPLDFPVKAPQGQAWIVRYYFWPDFVLRLGELDPQTRKPLDPNAAYEFYERRQIEEKGLRVPPPRAFQPARPRPG